MHVSRASWRIHKSLLVIAAALLSACGEPEPRAVLFADGTRIFLLNGTQAVAANGFPENREIRLQGNGEVFVKAPERDKPLIIRTGLLILTVDGDTAFRALVSSKKIGEQAEVLYGHVRAVKAYPSRYSEPDDLVGGEMSMVNQSIDLMEKEKFDPTELELWSTQIVSELTARTDPIVEPATPPAPAPPAH
ncbi:MAG: FecR domain-containing protein [Proteobacteria bacterium]|nr:FecR domain-containing protein [Pseudomonadota bacterium]